MAKEKTQTVDELQKVEAALVKLRRKMGRADINYTVQVSIASTDPRVVRYAAQMTAPADGLAPVTFIGDSADELVAKIKIAAKNIDYDAIEVAYHEAQIQSCERTIVGHKERIETIKNPPKEAEGENTNESGESDAEKPTE